MLKKSSPDRFREIRLIIFGPKWISQGAYANTFLGFAYHYVCLLLSILLITIPPERRKKIERILEVQFTC